MNDNQPNASQPPTDNSDPWGNVVVPERLSGATFFSWGSLQDGKPIEVSLAENPRVASKGYKLRSQYALCEFEGTVKGDAMAYLFAVSSHRLFAELVKARPTKGTVLRLTAKGPADVSRTYEVQTLKA